jgi:uncharacterized damage-inducible protein DinB
MMAIHPLVVQLRFTRSEFLRCLAGVDDQDARRRIQPMNCISWMVGHLADQEHRYWIMMAQGKVLFPELNDLVGFQKPASTPPLEEMWTAWRQVTATADPYLDSLTPELLTTHFIFDGKKRPESIGTMLFRNIHHYWFHIGEASAARQMLGHTDLPQFVGDMSEAGYRPEG